MLHNRLVPSYLVHHFHACHESRIPINDQTASHTYTLLAGITNHSRTPISMHACMHPNAHRNGVSTRKSFTFHTSRNVGNSTILPSPKILSKEIFQNPIPPSSYPSIRYGSPTNFPNTSRLLCVSGPKTPKNWFSFPCRPEGSSSGLISRVSQSSSLGMLKSLAGLLIAYDCCCCCCGRPCGWGLPISAVGATL